MNSTNLNLRIAPSITKAASKQTYYTIRFLADRELVPDAYRAYAYFRWVDDSIDTESGSGFDRGAFVNRQKSLLEKCYRGRSARDATIEEQMLVELIQHDTEKNSGLQCYLRNMMAVMAFDAERRGRTISQIELNEYTRLLASAVTEALHHFIGHDSYAPHHEGRYMAVTAAHITHMLRDTFDDAQAGYFNIPSEVLDANHIGPQDVQSDAYRSWVQNRIQLARTYFREGRQYLSQVENLRCRFACFAYVERFEWLLDTIEREDYHIRPQYRERKRFGNALRMISLALSSMIDLHRGDMPPRTVPVRSRSLR